ncbi:MAG: hypothetical protein EOO90_06340 [Pedobacter sp.]|nr:MAG: hypothetical protein EOO90_06340 [Pedobacter sp.]
MTWLHFTLWLAAAYACYYVTLILIDATKSSSSGKPDEQIHMISFEPESKPEKVPLRPATSAPKDVVEPASTAFGGVNLKGLFELARTESIHYTAGVNF